MTIIGGSRIVAVAFAFSILGMCSQVIAAESQEITASVNKSSGEIVEGEPIEISIKVTNNDAKLAECFAMLPFDTLDIKVDDSKSKPANKTNYGNHLQRLETPLRAKYQLI